MNNFQTDLAYSFDEDNFFTNFYYKIFSNIEKIEYVEDLERQKKGIDRVIYFDSGTTLTFDEKKRRVDYSDILLELWSVYEQKRRGWLFTDQCDYIAYAVMPTSKIFLLPTVLLKRAWVTNGSLWLSTYRTLSAQNLNYTTINIAIPTDILLNAISNEMCYNIKKEE